MKSKLTTIKGKQETIAAKKPKRIMGFRKWCETRWKPREHSVSQTFLNTPQGTVHGQH